MDTKQLKQKILDLAIRGKLVPQDPNDEPASVLLERIRKEKEQLIASGKLKKSKSKTTDKPHYENVPFDIPQNWVWVRIKDIAISELGKTLDKGKNSGELNDYLCALNVKWGAFDLTTVKQILLEDKEKERYLVRKGDLLICEGGDVGRAAIWENEKEIYYQNALHRVRFKGGIDQYFYLYALQYYKHLGFIDDVSGGVTIKHFTQNSMQKLLFPLPPLTEQKRIADSIVQWFALIDEIEANKKDLQEYIKQTKSKVLDLAIHGKLVPQDPNDEPAIDLLKRINPSFKPCDTSHYENLPQGWCVASIEQLCSIIGGLWTGKKPPYVNVGVIRNTNFTKDFKLDLTNTAYLDVEAKQFANRRLQYGDIILEKSGGSEKQPVGRTILYNREEGDFSFSNFTAVLRIKNADCLLSQYLQYALVNAYLNGATRFMQKQTTGIHNLIMDKYTALMIPIPPLAEQKRIVEAIETIYKQLNAITAEL